MRPPLIAALAAALVCASACEAGQQPPPPYHVYFRADADGALVRDTRESADDWNAKLGQQLLVVHAPGERSPEGACDVVSVGRSGKQATATSVATSENDSCGVELRITVNANDTSVRHELGHALGLPDGESGI